MGSHKLRKLHIYSELIQWYIDEDTISNDYIFETISQPFTGEELGV